MDVLGLPVAEARRRLAAGGVAVVSEVETAPPRWPLPAGTWRVVRQRTQAAGHVELVTAIFPEVGVGSPRPESWEQRNRP